MNKLNSPGFVPSVEQLVPLVLNLTLLLVLMYSGIYWFTKIPLSILFISAFIWPCLLKKPEFWFAALSFVTAEISLFWYEADNHKYLTAYWLMTVMIMTTRPEDQQLAFLKWHGRFYLILCMSFAVLWKSISKDFLDGSFFHFTLLTDERFAPFTHFLTGLPIADLSANRDAWDGIFHLTSASQKLMSNAYVGRLARFMVWLTIGLEALIPICFLIFHRKIWIAHSLLIFFIGVTYPVATVIGFAWLLILFALTQCDRPEQGRWRLMYCFLFIATQSFKMDFGNVAQSLLR